MGHTTVLDVLLSPLALLTQDIMIPAVVLTMGGLFYYWVFVFVPKYHKKNRDKKWHQKLSNVEKLDKKYAKPQSTGRILTMLATVVLALYLGLDMGRGWKIAKQIENGEVKSNHKIIFRDGQMINARIVGQNSLYLFYVIDNEKRVTITPIEENIKQIKKLNQEESN